MSKITTEQLDELQFGKQLHQRPTNDELNKLVSHALMQARAAQRYITWEELADAVLKALREAGALK